MFARIHDLHVYSSVYLLMWCISIIAWSSQFCRCLIFSGSLIQSRAWMLFVRSPSGVCSTSPLSLGIPASWRTKYGVSSNNSLGRLLIFSHQKGTIIRGRRLFKILLIGWRALNIYQLLDEFETVTKQSYSINLILAQLKQKINVAWS